MKTKEYVKRNQKYKKNSEHNIHMRHNEMDFLVIFGEQKNTFFLITFGLFFFFRLFHFISNGTDF